MGKAVSPVSFHDTGSAVYDLQTIPGKYKNSLLDILSY
jgi:hypothetical protein